MSKHIFEQVVAGGRYEVQIGWDKPTQQYYGMILEWVEDKETPDGGYYDFPVWSDMDESLAPLSLETIAEKITQRGFTIPGDLLQNVVSDKWRNAVNEFKFYTDTQANQNMLTLTNG